MNTVTVTKQTVYTFSVNWEQFNLIDHALQIATSQLADPEFPNRNTARAQTMKELRDALVTATNNAE